MMRVEPLLLHFFLFCVIFCSVYIYIYIYISIYIYIYIYSHRVTVFALVTIGCILMNDLNKKFICSVTAFLVSLEEIL